MDDKREVVGASIETEVRIKDKLKELAERAEQVYEKITISREEIDPRVLQLERELHRKNEERARAYGLEYTPPQVLYLDRIATFQMAKQMEESLKGTEMGKVLGGTFSVGGVFISLPNTVVVFSKGFDDREADAYWTAFLLRHEIAHAGSVQKIQARFPEHGSVDVYPYRTGSILTSERKGTVGTAITEGHNSLEDTLMKGELEGKFTDWKADRFLDKDAELSKKLPDGYRNYLKIKGMLVEQGKMPEGRILTGYKKRDLGFGRQEESISSADDYAEFRELMTAIYDRNPEIFGLTEDLIYGDKFVSFARKLDETFGQGFFSKLMRVTTPEEAKELIREINTHV